MPRIITKSYLLARDCRRVCSSSPRVEDHVWASQHWHWLPRPSSILHHSTTVSRFLSVCHAVQRFAARTNAQRYV